MYGQEKVSAPAIFAGVGDLALRYARVWVLAAGFVAVAMTGLDLALAGETAAVASISGSIISFFVNYHVAEAVLRGESLQVSSSRSYGSLFGASLLTSLGTGLAFVLLIVPGLYCMARWSMVTPLIVAEGRPATGAMSESWARTKDSAWALCGVYAVYALGIAGLVVLAGTAGALGVMDVETAPSGTIDLIMPFVVNLASSAIGMIGTLIAIAVYRALAGSSAGYDDVFG